MLLFLRLQRYEKVRKKNVKTTRILVDTFHNDAKKHSTLQNSFICKVELSKLIIVLVYSIVKESTST